MMRINPEPVVLTAEEIIHDLTYYCFDMGMKEEILMMNKKEFKQLLVSIANYRAYNYEGHDTSYHDGTLDPSEKIEWVNTECLMKVKLYKMFPAFKQEGEEE